MSHLLRWMGMPLSMLSLCCMWEPFNELPEGGELCSLSLFFLRHVSEIEKRPRGKLGPRPTGTHLPRRAREYSHTRLRRAQREQRDLGSLFSPSGKHLVCMLGPVELEGGGENRYRAGEGAMGVKTNLETATNGAAIGGVSKQDSRGGQSVMTHALRGRRIGTFLGTNWPPWPW